MYDVWKRPARLVRNVGVFLFFFFVGKKFENEASIVGCCSL